MNWFKKSQYNGDIKIIDYDQGILRALVNGQDRCFQNVNIESYNKLKRYLKFWLRSKAMGLLNKFEEMYN